MVEGIRSTTTNSRRGSSFAQRRILDAIVVDGRETWPLLAREIDDLLDLLDLDGDPTPLRVCRRIDPDGTLVLGSADPDRDPLLSFVVGGVGGEAT